MKKKKTANLTVEALCSGAGLAFFYLLLLSPRPGQGPVIPLLCISYRNLSLSQQCQSIGFHKQNFIVNIAMSGYQTIR